MKAVTEFWSPKLAEGIKVKTALAAEGKTPEEISIAIGEKFKFEGGKLKCFLSAVELAGQSTEKIVCIKIVKLNEGQNPPSRGKIIEDLCYITEVQANAADGQSHANVKDGGRGGKGGNRSGRPGGKGGGKPKGSPWGVSPEEKEAKLEAARQAAREKSLAGKKS